MLIKTDYTARKINKNSRNGVAQTFAEANIFKFTVFQNLLHVFSVTYYHYVFWFEQYVKLCVYLEENKSHSFISFLTRLIFKLQGHML